MHSQFSLAAMTQCSACGYDLAGAVSLTCPECGYVITKEDIEHDTRRRVFLELTAARPWIWGTVLTFLAVVFAWGVPLLFVAQAALAGLHVVRGEVGLRRRMLWRAWLLAAVWLQLLWVVPTLFVVAEWGGWRWTLLDWSRGYTPYEVLLAVSVGAALAIPLWWASWRRSCSTLGVPGDDPARARVFKAIIIAFAPQGVLVALFGVLYSALSLLDRYWPGWYHS